MSSQKIYIMISFLLFIMSIMIIQPFLNVKEPLEASHLADYFPTYYTKVPRGTSSPTGTSAPKGTSSPTGTSAPKGTSSPTGTSAPKGTSVPLTTTMNNLLQFV